LNTPSLDLSTLRSAYASGELDPADVIGAVYDQIEQRPDDKVWITLVRRSDALAAVEAQRKRFQQGASLPLYGVPFAVKDNIDVAPLPTTAGCPDYSNVPSETAAAVALLLKAGAILVGKTNLDQFAAGLTGVRSPYGACANVFNPKYISGGSSSGSSVAVAAGLVSFALGTDTAGSGRVPAAFNNIVGLKPTRGLVSTRGVVPACRSLDCVSVFTLCCADARTVIDVLAQFDPKDTYARPAAKDSFSLRSAFRFGVPAPEYLEFFGDLGAAALFKGAVERLVVLGGVPVEIDYRPFRDVANLLYSGPWVAERLAAITPFFQTHPNSLHPITQKIIGGGANYSAVDAFEAFYLLEHLRRQTDEQWEKMDVMVVPTAGTIYTIAEVTEDPIQLNSNLGYYTNFVNLLDLCGIAVPAGIDPRGQPFGISILGPAFADAAVIALAGRFHKNLGGMVGSSQTPVASLPEPPSPAVSDGVKLAVVGAHLRGQPLNHQLTSLGATFVRSTRTASDYRLYALAGTVPPKPGLVRATGFGGPGIEVEVWNLTEAAFGAFVSAIPTPLGIGTLRLEDKSLVKGFICEPFAIEGAIEITRHGGWRAYLGSLSAQKEANAAHGLRNPTVPSGDGAP
jgi:allophanate hydrolase